MRPTITQRPLPPTGRLSFPLFCNALARSPPAATTAAPPTPLGLPPSCRLRPPRLSRGVGRWRRRRWHRCRSRRRPRVPPPRGPLPAEHAPRRAVRAVPLARALPASIRPIDCRSYAVRLAASVAYGSLCSIACSASLNPNGRQSSAITGGLVDRFIGWALPLVRDVSVGDSLPELALVGLQEFLSNGDAASLDRYALPILKSCQQLLEDDRTSLNLLHQILGILSLISVKFWHCFQPHFIDIVDLLLGWALMPDLPESERYIIMDTFLQFKNHWTSNLQVSVKLLLKFLGDMEVLIQDKGVNSDEVIGRLLALFSCFATVLQASTTDLLESDLLKQISEPLESMIPQLLACLSLIGQKSGWEKWTGEYWNCLILLAKIFQEKFSGFYPSVVDIFFQNLKVLPTSQLPSVLKANIQLLSAQKSGLHQHSVKRLLHFDSPLSLLRLHPNHLVVGNLAGIYLVFLWHSSDAVVLQAVSSIMEDLEVLRNVLEEYSSKTSHGETPVISLAVRKSDLASKSFQGCSLDELILLIKFDLNILACCLSTSSGGNIMNFDVATQHYERVISLMSFICKTFNPFMIPVRGFLELQVHVVGTMHKLSKAELSCKLAISNSWKKASDTCDTKLQGSHEDCILHSTTVFECLNKYTVHLVRCLNNSSPLAVKEEALEWINSFCAVLTKVDTDSKLDSFICGSYRPINASNCLLSAVLDAASDREIKVRSRVALVLEQYLHANLIHPGSFYLVAEVALDRLGDPDSSVKRAFAKVLTNVLPAAFLTHGILADRFTFYNLGPTRLEKNLNWKQILAVKQFPRQLQSQHLVTILSYISQRWKVPLASWIQRLVFSCMVSKDSLFAQQAEERNFGLKFLVLGEKMDGTLLERMCPVNNLAAVWWSIHEAARYSVCLRLRTNLGGPTQTFAALERMLLDVAHVLLLDTEHTDGNLSIGNSRIHLLPMRLLLDFVESLKKHVYNAYEGSAILPYPTRQSSSFFLANKKVCEEWFTRIADPMLNAGLALQCHDAALCYSASRLQDLQKLMPSLKEKNRGTPASENSQSFRFKIGLDTMKTLHHAALALCRIREPEALDGLHNWAIKTFSTLFTEGNKTNLAQDGAVGCFSWIVGLVYQAQGQYEKAAAFFSHLLQTEEVLSFMGSEGIQFVIQRIIESFTAISDWKSLETWLSELQALRSKHAGKAYCGALTTAGTELNAIHALACFDEGNAQAAWAYLDLTPKSSSELTLDPKLALERSEQMLLRALLQKDEQLDKVIEKVEKAEMMLDEVLSVAPLEGMGLISPYIMQLHCLFALKDGLRLHNHENILQFCPTSSSIYNCLNLPIGTVHQDCGLWLKILRVYRTVLPTSPVTLFLCQNLVTLARKQSNLMLAERLSQYLRDNILKFSQGALSELLFANLQYESILLNYAAGNYEDAVTSIWSLVRKHIISSETVSSESYKMMYAKAFLKLSSWLKQDCSSKSPDDVINKIYADMIKSDMRGACLSRNRCASHDNELMSMSNRTAFLEELVGISVKLSCQLCPTMGKAWLSYASWCYSQARSSFSLNDTFLKSCSLSPILLTEFPPDRFQLNEEEVSRVKTIITNFFLHMAAEKSGDRDDMNPFLLPKETATLNSLIQQAIYLMESSAGAPGVEDCIGECPSSLLASQLHSLLLHANSKLQIEDVSCNVEQLVNVWWQLRQRRVSLFGHAAFAYLQYLSCPSKLQSLPGFQPNQYFSSEKAGSCTLRATLYVLNILLNYGVELREMIEPGLASVPMLPWQEITPQLFARLVSHPQKEVRGLLEGLLMMLAKLSPWSIVYPTLVDTKNIQGDSSVELQRLLDCLGKLYPSLVKDAQLMINELGNITVLWEEHWLSTLQDLHSDVLRRINMLKEETRRIAENPTLSESEKKKINAAKYTAVMAPIVVALERRLQSTSRDPQTPHEEWFQKEYGEQIKNAITDFKTPPSSPALGDAWQPFEAIATSLLNYQRKSSVTMSDVAPRLAKLSASEVPMPGLEKQISFSDLTETSGQIRGLVTVSSFSEKVTILATKTKPKKIVIQGSDGQNYVYLLKGREDLRLDARIMQLLQAVNSFLSSCTETRCRSLAVRHYSVTPISGRAGLIQWVDNVISIYTIFKSWQERAQLACGSGNTNKMVPTVPRPSDMFYGKIIPALKEKGIKRVISRKDWPHEVKRKVLLDLMREVPREFLRQEIWCASEGFAAYSSKSKMFSSSIAAMSMVGHILGLGDRHLDNILMDFSSGDIIHIDYNVCFDKGRRLKIPEIVPFRLTQTIEAALGLTGTEGTFKANCEAVIRVLQRNKDVLLMMLDVFVWDPLIEWTRGDVDDEAAIGGEEKKGMELAVSLSLFASRFHEIRVPLQEHHDLLITTLPTAESALEKFLNVLNQYEIISAIFYHVEQERSTLVQRETSTKSVLSEATSLSEKAWASFEFHSHEFTQAKVTATEKVQEATKWTEQHGRVLDALRGGSFPIVQAYIKLGGTEEAFSLTSAVAAAGVPLTIVPEPTQAQCYELDKEVSRLVMDLDSGVSLASETLQQYSLALQRVLPLNYITTSPVSGWSQILKLSINNMSSEFFSIARRQAAEIIRNARGDASDSEQKRHHQELLLDMENYATHIKKVNNECLELANSIGPDTEAKSKERLLSAFKKFMHSGGFVLHNGSSTHAGQSKHDTGKDAKVHGDLQEKRKEVLVIIQTAASTLFQEVKVKVLDMSCNTLEGVGWRLGRDASQPKWGTFFLEFEEQIEKCAHITEFVSELQELVGFTPDEYPGKKDVGHSLGKTWVFGFQECLHSCNSLIEQMTEYVLPEVIKLAISYHAEVMEAFGSISQIRGSTDTALEQLIEVELEKTSLADLEENYCGKVETVTKQQLALEEAAKQGRDHLSWEEAEELATQEEACKALLDRLHQSWNQRDMVRSALEKREANIRLSVVTSEHQFSCLVNIDSGGNSHANRSKVLLNMLAKPFHEFELIDQLLPSCSMCASDLRYTLAEFRSLSSLSDSVWKFGRLLKNHSFFLWKVNVIDSVLDSCIRDISSFVDHSLGFEQLCNVLKKKLEIQLQEYIGQYLKDRVALAFLMCLENENVHLKHLHEPKIEIVNDGIPRGSPAITEVQRMLVEYCKTHETARAARSAICLRKRQMSELTEALRKTILEIVQIEWLCNHAFSSLSRKGDISRDIVGDDILYPIVLGLDRSKLLENLQTSVSSIAKSLEYLQLSERTSVSAEAQLERAMGWACAGSSASGSNVKNSGIPPEFHDHILTRRKLLRGAQERASNIMNVCTSILEFEASRDGLFQMVGDVASGHPVGDGQLWQQIYMNSLTRLDATYHSFKISEQEWRLAQKNMEAAANSLFSATSELSVASVKAKSAAGEFQDILTTMKDCACEVNVALSNFSHVSRGQTTLTSECGIMLEEILAIAEGLHDINKLAKEAAVVHGSLMADLNKFASVLQPLETSLSADLATHADAVTSEHDSNIGVTAVHGQLLYKTYSSRVRECCQSVKSLVPSVTSSVKELHGMLTKLAKTAGLHARNLHKALEGLGESQALQSQDLALSSDVVNSPITYSDRQENEISSTQGDDLGEALDLNGFSLQEEGYISPPDTIYTSSLESVGTSTEAGLSESSDKTEVYSDLIHSRDSAERSGPFHLNNDGDVSIDKLGSGLTEDKDSGIANSGPSASLDLSDHKRALSLQDGASMAPFGLDVLFDIDKDISKNTTPSSGKDVRTVLYEDGKGEDFGQEGSANLIRGKNPYALSVLRQVEKKLDGRDIEENRSISISEQVEYLIRQATSLDNLCNMYEGWTPWI